MAASGGVERRPFGVWIVMPLQQKLAFLQPFRGWRWLQLRPPRPSVTMLSIGFAAGARMERISRDKNSLS
jgi:hypothetical protein